MTMKKAPVHLFGNVGKRLYKTMAWKVTGSFTGHLIKPFVILNKWVTNDDETSTSTPVCECHRV